MFYACGQAIKGSYICSSHLSVKSVGSLVPGEVVPLRRQHCPAVSSDALHCRLGAFVL